MVFMSGAPIEFSKFVFTETVGSIVRFPLWWYSDGLIQLGEWIAQELRYRWKAYSFAIWIKNILVPMYGQYDWSGRLVSFFMRVVVLIGRGIGLVFEAAAYAVLAIAYVFLPPVAVILLVFSLLV